MAHSAWPNSAQRSMVLELFLRVAPRRDRFCAMAHCSKAFSALRLIVQNQMLCFCPKQRTKFSAMSIHGVHPCRAQCPCMYVSMAVSSPCRQPCAHLFPCSYQTSWYSKNTSSKVPHGQFRYFLDFFSAQDGCKNQPKICSKATPFNAFNSSCFQLWVKVLMIH